RVHIEVGHVREDVFAQPRLLVDGPRRLGLALQQPASSSERQACHCGHDHDIPELHETPRGESAVTAMTSRQAASCTAFFDCVASTCTTPGPAARRYASSTRRGNESSWRSNRSWTLRAACCRARPTSTGTSRTSVTSGTRPPVASRMACATASAGSPPPATWY